MDFLLFFFFPEFCFVGEVCLSGFFGCFLRVCLILIHSLLFYFSHACVVRFLPSQLLEQKKFNQILLFSNKKSKTLLLSVTDTVKLHNNTWRLLK